MPTLGSNRTQGYFCHSNLLLIFNLSKKTPIEDRFLLTIDGQNQFNVQAVKGELTKCKQLYISDFS